MIRGLGTIMPLRCSSQSPRTHFSHLGNLFGLYRFQRVSEIASKPDFGGRYGTAGFVWFVKVVCTLYVRQKSLMKVAAFSDYLGKNLNSLIAFNVIQHMSNNWKNPKLAFSFLQFTRVELNLVHSVDTYKLVLSSVCHLGLLDLAKLIVEYMWNDGFLLSSELLGFVVTLFANAGEFDVAKELLVDYSRYNIENAGAVRCGVYNNLLSLLVKRNRVDEAVALFENIILSSNCYYPDTFTFNIVIGGLCRAAEVDKAFMYFKQMSSFGCSPDLVTYNTLSSGFCRVGDVDKAHELLRDMCLTDGRSPNVVSYTSVISGYCKLGEMAKALSLFDEMIGVGIRPNIVTLNVIIDGFGKIGDMVSALRMYEKMLDHGCTPDVITFTSIIDGHCRLGELNQGLKVWKEMNRRKLYPNAYTFSILINSLCNGNRLNEARDLLMQLKMRDDIVPEPFLYNPVIDGFCKAGNVDEANVIVEEMMGKKCKPDKLTFTILIIGHCMKGRMVEALSIFNKMQEVGCTPDSVTVNKLVSCLLKAGMSTDASKIRTAALENEGMSFTQRSTSTKINMDVCEAI